MAGSLSLSSRLLLSAVLAAAAASLCSAAEQNAPRRLLASSNSTSVSRLAGRDLQLLMNLQMSAHSSLRLLNDHNFELTTASLQTMAAVSSITAALPSAVRSLTRSPVQRSHTPHGARMLDAVALPREGLPVKVCKYHRRVSAANADPVCGNSMQATLAA